MRALLHVVKSGRIVRTSSSIPTSPAPDMENYIGAKAEFRLGRVASSFRMGTIVPGSSLLDQVPIASTQVVVEGPL